jgi:hypothetical protein
VKNETVALAIIFERCKLTTKVRGRTIVVEAAGCGLIEGYMSRPCAQQWSGSLVLEELFTER